MTDLSGDPTWHWEDFHSAGGDATDDDGYELEIEPGGPCCSCKEPIELGYMIVDEDGYRYCEGCWQP